MMMETLLETVELDADETNELLFKVAIEGHAAGPARVRMVCEAGDISLMFPGRPGTDGLVQFIIPKNQVMKEGTYLSKIEVLVDNKYFVPVEFNLDLKKQVQVFAEAVKHSLPQPPQEIKISATPIVVKKQQPVQNNQPKKIGVVADSLAARYHARRKH